MSIEIKTGVKIPTIQRRCKYPFSDMQVGGSLHPKTEIEYRNCRTSAQAYGKKHNMKFLSRIENDNGVVKYGIWRIE